MNEPSEIIKDDSLTQMLRDWIESKRVCRMEIPDTGYGWFTVLSGFEREKDTDFLAIDPIAGLEKLLSSAGSREVSFQFLEKDGVRCFFKTRIVRVLSNKIRAELPKVIHRLQKRSFFRIDALSGTEMSFHLCPEREEKAKVKDYSIGGVSFFIEDGVGLEVNERITEIRLGLPQRKGLNWVHIPAAVIKRIEKDVQGREVCALEFLEVAERTKEQLWNNMLETQRRTLLKLNKAS